MISKIADLRSYHIEIMETPILARIGDQQPGGSPGDLVVRTVRRATHGPVNVVRQVEIGRRALPYTVDGRQQLPPDRAGAGQHRVWPETRP